MNRTEIKKPGKHVIVLNKIKAFFFKTAEYDPASVWHCPYTYDFRTYYSNCK